MSGINRVLFMGSKQLGLRVLQEIYSMSPGSLIGVMTIDDASDTRTMRGEFESFATQNGVDLHVAKNRTESEQIIHRLQPDLCIVVGWYWLISKAAIDSVPFGFVGIHNSLLPSFRGGSPLVWQLLNEEREVGFSLFSFTPGMDDGPIWAQGRVSVHGHEYVSDVLCKLEGETLAVLRDVYPSILQGTTAPVEQKEENASYCAQRNPDDGNIDWHESANAVCNFIRAQSDPYPGAFTYYESMKLKVWRARAFEHKYFGTPGQVARITEDGVFVVCGDDRAIVLEDVELGGTRGKATEIIKSLRRRMTPTPARPASDESPEPG